MPHIGVIFEIRRAETRPGEHVSVVGNCPELGNWDPYDCKVVDVQLRTGAKQYPKWAMPTPIWIELEDDGDQKASSNIWHDPAEEEEEDDWTAPPSPTAAYSGAGSPNQQSTPAVVTTFGTTRLEYKYIKDRRQSPEGGPSIQWEESITNRRVNIPTEAGSIWIVSDNNFNQFTEPVVTRTTLAEVLARRQNLDPEWTHLRDDDDEPESDHPRSTGLSSSNSVGTDLTNFSRHTNSTVFFWGQHF